MRKIYSFFAFAAMMLVSLTANAWSFDLTEENAVLQSEAYNMRLYKNYNFFGGTFNGEPFDVTGDGCFVLSTDKADFKLNGFDSFQVLNPEAMGNFFIQIGTSALNLRAGVNKDGLHNYGSGSRFFAISDVKAGQIIVCQWGITSSRESVVQPSSAITGADACTFEDITEEIHAAQNADLEEGAEPVADNFSYWRATSDGYFVVEVQRDGAIQGLQIWIDAAAQEAISTPTLKVVGVNGDSRKIEFKPGESTFGNETKTFYSIDGSDPLYLKETDEVATWTYTYDEETGEKLDSVPETYKKILDVDAVAQYGTYGDYEFNPEDGSIEVFGSEDEDGDGIVVVKAAAVSLATGAVSNIATINVSIGEIVLNAPTVSLNGVSGNERTYKIAWANNTICGEDYMIKVEGDNGEYYNEYEVNLGIGELFTVQQNFKVTVSAPGYLDGVLEQEVDLAGTEFKRKNVSQDAEGNPIHDWDFVNLSQEDRDKFMGNVIGSYEEYVLNGEVTDTISHTVAEYEAAEAEGQDVSGWAPIAQTYGWGLPIASNRTTLNVVEGGVDMNANGFGYVEEEIGIFKNLAVSCPPNANNASCIFKYMDKADGNELGYLGVYFMARPTITFPREVAKAGEYVEIYYGQGGSNYTNTTTHQFYQVPEDEFLTVTLPSGGVHVFYIDVHTYDNLPEDLLENAEEAWQEVVAVEGVAANKTAASYFTVSGAKIAAPQKGINIVKYADGSVIKVLVK